VKSFEFISYFGQENCLGASGWLAPADKKSKSLSWKTPLRTGPRVVQPTGKWRRKHNRWAFSFAVKVLTLQGMGDKNDLRTGVPKSRGRTLKRHGEING